MIKFYNKSYGEVRAELLNDFNASPTATALHLELYNAQNLQVRDTTDPDNPLMFLDFDANSGNVAIQTSESGSAYKVLASAAVSNNNIVTFGYTANALFIGFCASGGTPAPTWAIIFTRTTDGKPFVALCPSFSAGTANPLFIVARDGSVGLQLTVTPAVSMTYTAFGAPIALGAHGGSVNNILYCPVTDGSMSTDEGRLNGTEYMRVLGCWLLR